MIRVKWSVPINIPDSYYETMTADSPAPRHDYDGELIGVVRAFGETRAVVLTDAGEFKEVAISQIRRV